MNRRPLWIWVPLVCDVFMFNIEISELRSEIRIPFSVSVPAPAQVTTSLGIIVINVTSISYLIPLFHFNHDFCTIYHQLVHPHHYPTLSYKSKFSGNSLLSKIHPPLHFCPRLFSISPVVTLCYGFVKNLPLAIYALTTRFVKQALTFKQSWMDFEAGEENQLFKALDFWYFNYPPFVAGLLY